MLSQLVPFLGGEIPAGNFRLTRPMFQSRGIVMVEGSLINSIGKFLMALGTKPSGISSLKFPQQGARAGGTN